MLRSVLAISLLLAAGPLAAQEYEPVSIDELQSIGSVIGGRDAPLWAPDGSGILFLSGLDGGLWTIDPDNGVQTRVAQGLARGVFSRATLRFRWSPDGRHIAFVRSAGEASEIFLWNVAEGSQRQLTNLGARVMAYSFSPDGRAIAFSSNRYGSNDIWTVSVADGRAKRLTADMREDVFPSWTPDGGKIIYTRLDEAWVDHDVFEIPAAGGTSKLILFDKDYFDYRNGASFGFVQASPDGKTLMFRSQRSGWAHYWIVPVGGGTPRQIASEEADQSEARWSPDGRHVLFLSISNGTQSLKVVPASGGRSTTLFSPTTGTVSGAEWSPDSRRISYKLGTPTSAADLYVVAAGGGTPKQLTFSAPGGGLASRLIKPEKVSWVNEGYTINAYLYKPQHLRAGERAPVIMLVHGGPTGQFRDNFQIQPQFFASRGYAVLAPNVRGSSGYGKAFEDANNRDWGHGDLRDVVAGVEWIKRQPYVNPDKIGITGISYGGMLTMYAIAHAPGVFQAAISGSGYGDVREFHTKVLVHQHAQLLSYELGKWPSTPEVDSIYRRSSSILKAKDVTTPTMFIHGYGLNRYDKHLPALTFAEELSRFNKVVRYKKYPNETYYVYGKENVKQVLTDMLAFFDQFLKDGATAAPELAASGGPDGG